MSIRRCCVVPVKPLDMDLSRMQDFVHVKACPITPEDRFSSQMFEPAIV